MSSTVAGFSAIENMKQLADYRVHIIVDDSQEIRDLIWGVVKNLLERFATETPFELTFVNNPEPERVESRASLAKMMKSVTPHGARDILEKLDNILLTELRELLVLPTKEVPDNEDPRSLENSVEFAVKSLVSFKWDSAVDFSMRCKTLLKVTTLDGSVATSKTYDLSAGFTFTGWIFQKDRQESSPYEFFSFYHGQAPLLRASREGQGNCVTMWFPDVSAYPTVRDCPTGVWTFICATHDGTGVRLGFNGHLGNKAPLAGLKFEKINFRMCASSSISLANIKIYDRVLAESEIHFDYFTSLPDISGPVAPAW
ncbi:hypothetical protein B0H14DRAFT_2590012 [Mycena olivaceomarginata]|nr:hypothetical protein B0H14DRAFT_2590012 [Mycena olivaceomarginata]